MNKIFKNKKIIIFSAIAISLFVFFLISSNLAKADAIDGALKAGRKVGAGGIGSVAGQFASAIGVSALNAAKWGIMIYGILLLLQYVLWWLISYGYTLLTAAVNMALDPSWFQIDAVINGWRLVRDFANIWFILILLFIAIGTILRAQSYQAKKLLPTLIMVALVINFSLPITGFIIDISNVISFQFLKAICPEVKNEEHCDFSANLENVLDAKGFSQSLAGGLPQTENPPAENNTENETGFLGTQKAHAALPAIVAAIWTGVQIVAIAGVAWDLGKSLFTEASPLGGVAVGPFVSIVVTNIFLLLTAFVVLSLALLFLIRIASLLFLAILSPLGFATAIIPATQKYSEKWWNYLFTQSFFAPFSLFFLWISLSLMGNIKDALTISGVSYDFTSPANARIIFYIFSLILMYASIWIAKQMGAMGASAIIGWWGSIQKGITGFASGLAGRLLVAPIGAAAISAGIPQAIGRISPLAGVKATELTKYLAGRGKAPEAAEAKASLGMQLAPAERAAYFARFDRAAKEAMLRKMKGDERESLIAGLSKATKEDGSIDTKQVAAGQEARSILSSATFTGEERLKTSVEKFKFEKNLVEQWQQFGTQLSPDEQKTFLLGIEDADKRAQFLDHVREEAQKSGNAIGTTAFQNANKFLEESTGFSANQRYANRLARYKVENTEAQKVNKLASFFETLGKTPEELEEIRKDPEKLKKFGNEQKRRFRFAMNDSQRLEILEAWKDPEHAEDLKRLQGWINEMDPADQDKFYRDSIGKRASLEGVVEFVKAVNTGDPARDFAIRKMVLSGASPKQLGSVAHEIPELIPLTDDLARTLSTQRRKEYDLAKEKGTPPPFTGPAPTGGGGGGTGGTPAGGTPSGSTPSAGGGATTTPVAPAPKPAAPAAPTTPTPTPTPTPTISPASPRIVILNAEVERINELDSKINADAIKKAIDNLSKEPQFERLRRKINILIDYEFIEPGPKDTFKQIEFLQKTIAERSPTELHYKIDAKTLANPTVFDAVMRKGNKEQLARLAIDEERATIIKERLNNPKMFSLTTTPVIVKRVIKERGGTEFSAQNMIVKDLQLYSEAISEIFETQYKNRELGKVFENIIKTPDGQLDQPDQILRKRLFK